MDFDIIDEIRSIKRTIRQNPKIPAKRIYSLADLALLLPDQIEAPHISQFPGNDFYLISFVKPKILHFSLYNFESSSKKCSW